MRFVYQQRVPQHSSREHRERIKFPVCSDVGQLSARREPFLPGGFLFLANAFHNNRQYAVYKKRLISNTLTHSISCRRARFIYAVFIGLKKRRRPANAESPHTSATHKRTIIFFDDQEVRSSFLPNFLRWYTKRQSYIRKVKISLKLVCCNWARDRIVAHLQGFSWGDTVYYGFGPKVSHSHNMARAQAKYLTLCWIRCVRGIYVHGDLELTLLYKWL